MRLNSMRRNDIPVSDMSDDQPLGARRWALMVLMGLIAVLVALDIAVDLEEGATLEHVLVELGIIAAALAGVALLGFRYRTARREVRGLAKDLEVARRDADRWRGEAKGALDGLGVAIQAQFARWHLTPAESEIGLFLLKGLSHREIADIRETSERTVRHQALTLYKKAGLAGRAELSAFFLEDLLLPASERGAERMSGEKRPRTEAGAAEG